MIYTIFPTSSRLVLYLEFVTGWISNNIAVQQYTPNSSRAGFRSLMS